MKKSIFLFFAAILCAIGMNAATKPELLYLSKDTWDTDGAWFAAYFYGDEGSAWAKMTYTSVTDKFVCKTPQDKNYTNVIFVRMNKNKKELSFDSKWNQTGNLELKSDKNCYTVTGWGENDGKWSNIPLTLTAVGTPEAVFTKEWDPNQPVNDLSLIGGIYQISKKNITLAKNTEVIYKVAKDHAWNNSWGGNYQDGNAGFQVSETYNYNITFTFDVCDCKLSHTYEKVEHYLTGNANLVGGEGWKANEVKMTYNTSTNNGTYTHTFSNLAAHTIYEMKVTDGTWDNNWDYDDLKVVPQNVSTFSDSKNIAFYLSEAGNVTVTFDAKTGKIEMTGNFAKIVPTINLLGLNNNWDATAENKMNSKSENIVSCTAMLTTGANEFKIYIKEFDKWYGNSVAIIRDNALVNKVLSDGGSNISIQADVDGEYEFIWNYETKELSVVYPNTTVEYEKIYFVNSDDWSKVYAHLWLENSEPVINNVTWPGADITANKEGTVNGYDIHYVTFIKGAYDKCIFNGGGGDDKKTDNLAIMDDYKYFYQVTGSWYANLEDIEASTNKFILGEFNNWAKEHGEFLKVDENIYSITIPITAGTYEFKVVDDAWLGNGGTMERGGTSVTTGGWTFKSDNNSKCKLVADIDGDYTFTWYSDTKKLTVQYPTLTITLTTGNNDDVIAANIGNTVDVIIERGFTADDGYYTLCVPFNMDPSVIGKAYSLGTITEHVAGEGININLEEETYMLSAGVPYLVLPKANMSELVVENVTIESVEASGQNVTNGEGTVKIFFEGFYSASGQTNGTTQYYVGNNGYLYNKVVDIRGLCGLFTITDENGDPLKVRARVVTREEVETGIDNNQLPNTNIQKLIENGQLIIIREGVKYNVQGQKL